MDRHSLRSLQAFPAFDQLDALLGELPQAPLRVFLEKAALDQLEASPLRCVAPAEVTSRAERLLVHVTKYPIHFAAHDVKDVGHAPLTTQLIQRLKDRAMVGVLWDLLALGKPFRGLSPILGELPLVGWRLTGAPQVFISQVEDLPHCVGGGVFKGHGPPLQALPGSIVDSNNRHGEPPKALLCYNVTT
jgi:hypothetical protein